MQERSKQYDWFKGNTNEKKDMKQNAKTVWKFSKIFLYFSLAFFSLWGCVQTFTNKTGQIPGSGVTMAKNDASLSPQTGILTLKDRNAGTKSFPDLYFDFANGYHAVNKDDGEEVIGLVNKKLKEQGKMESPSEGRNGGNYVLHLSKDSDFEFSGLKHNGLLGTTKGSSYDPTLYSSGWKLDTKDAQGKVALDTKLASKLAGIPAKFQKLTVFSVKEEDVQPPTAGKKQTIWKVDKKQNFIVDLTAPELETTSKDKLAGIFNIDLYNKILEAKIKGAAAGAPQTIGDLLEQTRIGIIGKTGALTDAEREEIAAYNRMVRFLTSIVLKTDGAGALVVDDITGRAVLAESPYGFKSDSTYKPITSWGAAWSKDGGMGPFYGLFVWPASYVTNSIIDAMPMMAGWESFITITLVVVMLSIVIFTLNFKNTLQQTKMQEMSAKKAVVDAKYAPYKGNKQMENRQRQEVADLYKKEGISPLSSLGGIFITMPLFLTMWRVIGTIDHIKGTTWLGIKFSVTSYKELLGNLGSWSGGWVYFPLMLLASGLSVISQMFPKLLTRKRDKNRINVQQKAAMKKSNRTQNIIMIVFAVFSLTFTAGIQVYFIIRSLWKIMEVYVTHVILIKQKQRKIVKATGG